MTILIIIAIVIAIPLILAIFTKKDYAIERQITINRPKQDIFNYIKYLKNQDNFSKWAKMDPDMKKDYSGTDGTPGFVARWDSPKKDVGKGEQEIIKITEGEKVELAIHFIKPFEGRANAQLSTTATGSDQTRVTWSLQSKMAYPMNIMLLFLNMEKMIGNDLEIGLGNLKELMEK